MLRFHLLLFFSFFLIFQQISLHPLSANPSLKARVFFQKGNVFLRTDQYKRAIKEYSDAIKLQQNHSHAYHKRGTAYFFLKQNLKACDDWKIACNLDNRCLGWNFGIYKKICQDSSPN